MSTTNKYKELSDKRKQLQKDGLLPEWFTTGGYQLLEKNYLWAENPKAQYQSIAKAAAKYVDGKLPIPDFIEYSSWEEAFFDIMWKGWMSPSTPVLSNMGNTDRGMPVSCSGMYVPDSVDGFYSSLHEAAMLTKHGFGTAGYLGDIRPRGSKISGGGTAEGILPVIKMFSQMSKDVSQGSSRRGAWASYIPIDHGDFHEVIGFLETETDSVNIGWCITDEFIERCDNSDEEAMERQVDSMLTKLPTGRGYHFFPDKANRLSPQIYKDRGYKIITSQLCSEIMEFCDENYTFTCVLSSGNLAKYNEWKDKYLFFIMTVFLDCVNEEFIQLAKDKNILHKAVRFAEESRSLGAGVMGAHTYLQSEMIPFEDLRAQFFNAEFSKLMNDDSLAASKYMAIHLGEPEWAKGYGIRNVSRLAIAPTKSTGLLMSGVSEGINPDSSMSFTQLTAAGEVARVNPELLKLMKKKNVYSKRHIDEVASNVGSVQHVNWLTAEEKLVFKTAFEIDQHVVIRYASIRQRNIDQGQSLNLFFAADSSEEYIRDVHQAAWRDPYILSLYYIYSSSEVRAAQQNTECIACQ